MDSLELCQHLVVLSGNTRYAGIARRKKEFVASYDLLTWSSFLKQRLWRCVVLVNDISSLQSMEIKSTHTIPSPEKAAENMWVSDYVRQCRIARGSLFCRVRRRGTH